MIGAYDNRNYEIRIYHLADRSFHRPILEITHRGEAIDFCRQWNQQAINANENFRVFPLLLKSDS